MRDARRVVDVSHVYRAHVGAVGATINMFVMSYASANRAVKKLKGVLATGVAPEGILFVGNVDGFPLLIRPQRTIASADRTIALRKLADWAMHIDRDGTAVTGGRK
jgi:hypothetical protein